MYVHCCCVLQAQQSGDVGRVMMVLITDGRANVTLAKSNEDPAALEPDAPKPTADELKVRYMICRKWFELHLLQTLIL
jgi:magnesium chelatase subunit D